MTPLTADGKMASRLAGLALYLTKKWNPSSSLFNHIPSARENAR
jgi:hypothetical protein